MSVFLSPLTPARPLRESLAGRWAEREVSDAPRDSAESSAEGYGLQPKAEAASSRRRLAHFAEVASATKAESGFGASATLSRRRKPPAPPLHYFLRSARDRAVVRFRMSWLERRSLSARTCTIRFSTR